MRSLWHQGVSPQRILRETASYDTVGNGYFATTMHAVPAQWRCSYSKMQFIFWSTWASMQKSEVASYNHLNSM